LPVEELKTLCTKLKIQLVETCISDKNGNATLYKGTFREEENLNLNSLRNDWWGVGKDQVEVKTSTLQNVLQNLGIKRISCLNAISSEQCTLTMCLNAKQRKMTLA